MSLSVACIVHCAIGQSVFVTTYCGVSAIVAPGANVTRTMESEQTCKRSAIRFFMVRFTPSACWLHGSNRVERIPLRVRRRCPSERAQQKAACKNPSSFRIVFFIRIVGSGQERAAETAKPTPRQPGKAVWRSWGNRNRAVQSPSVNRSTVTLTSGKTLSLRFGIVNGFFRNSPAHPPPFALLIRRTNRRINRFKGSVSFWRR